MTALLLAVGAAVALPAAQPALADAAGQGGDYVPLGGGVRVVDTANGVGTTKGVRGPASTTTFQVLGVGAVPATGVRAVQVDITTKAPTAITFLTLWPGDVATRPGVGTINVTPNEQISNSAIVEVGANGKISMYNNAGNVNVLVDVLGYFTTVTGPSGSGGFVPVPSNPTVVSTGSGIGVPVGTIPAGGSRTASLLGGIVPAGSPAVFVDLQVAGATAAGWVGTTPTGGSGQSSSLEFGTGTTSSGASIRLAADGRVNIVNNSTAAISMLIRLQGYFTASNTQGAGLRPVLRRLIDTPLPANGTVDVAVGGTNGLPIKNIAGAALNFTAASPTEGGYFKAWPLNSAEPNSSVTVWPADKQRGGMAILKPGTDGKIRVKSVSTGTVRLIVDLQGWFSDPLPSLAPVAFSPTTVLQPTPAASQLGTLEYAYVDNIGRARLGHQTSVDDFGSVQWTTAAGNNAFTGRPGMSQLSDGRVQVTAQNEDSDFWAIGQTSAGSAAWGDWSDLGGSMASTPTQVTLANGTTVIFAVDDEGKLWHYRPVTSTSYWRSLGDQDLVGAVVAAPVQQGVQLFARDTAGALRTALYAVDGSLSAWTSLGGAGIADSPSVVVYPGYRMRVVVRAGDGTVQTKLQETGGGWPAAWDTVGDFAAVGAPAAILDPVLGRVAVVARGTDSEVHRVFETGQGTGSWGDWAPVNADTADPAATDPTVVPFTNGSGQSWMIVYRNANDATRVYSRQVPAAALRAKASTAEPRFERHAVPAPPDAG
ncbi:hypothetical protein [Actinoplanes sp. NPDC026623]|uniref:hypothetical protein n=1 Tax=Actinoplanes sp. NPDC026623 TaxID=3155610 RepID=UPI0033EAE7FB